METEFFNRIGQKQTVSLGSWRISLTDSEMVVYSTGNLGKELRSDVPRYRAIVEGRNFLLEIDGARRRYGFFQTVFIDCVDAAHAEKDAVAYVKADADLRTMTLNAVDDPPVLHLDSVAELADGVPLPPQPHGRTLFPSKRWWQFWRGM